jgi:hypothetical protein
MDETSWWVIMAKKRDPVEIGLIVAIVVVTFICIYALNKEKIDVFLVKLMSV